MSVVSCLLWFLTVGALNHYNSDSSSSAATIFWCFIIFVLFIPAGAALIMLGVVLHLVNYVSTLRFDLWKYLMNLLREIGLQVHLLSASCGGWTRLCGLANRSLIMSQTNYIQWGIVVFWIFVEIPEVPNQNRGTKQAAKGDEPRSTCAERLLVLLGETETLFYILRLWGVSGTTMRHTLRYVVESHYRYYVIHYWLWLSTSSTSYYIIILWAIRWSADEFVFSIVRLSWSVGLYVINM